MLPPVVDNSKEIDEEVAKEWEHTMLQNTMGKELNELNKRLEEKEVIMIISMIFRDFKFFFLFMKKRTNQSVYCV